MRPNRHIIFPLDNIEDVAQIMAVPYGDLFKIGMNRWNGNVVMSFQDHPEARFYIRLIIGQLSEYVDMFDEDNYRDARHGLLPDSLDCEDCSGLYSGHPADFEEVA